MNLLQQILANPIEYENDAILGLIAQQLIPAPEIESLQIPLNTTGVEFNVFGGDQIEEGALIQIRRGAGDRECRLIDVLGKFIPRIVKMDGTAPKKWR